MRGAPPPPSPAERPTRPAADPRRLAGPTQPDPPPRSRDRRVRLARGGRPGPAARRAVPQTLWLADRILPEVPCFSFTGLDVVPSVIDRNRADPALRALGPRVTFQVAELSRGLPGGPYDLVLSRDALQHLPWETAAEVLAGYCASGSALLLVGSYPEGDGAFRRAHGADAARAHANASVELGSCATVDLAKPPFSLPPPVEAFDEDFDGKHLYLYHLPTLCAGNFARDLLSRVRAAAAASPRLGPVVGCHSGLEGG